MPRLGSGLGGLDWDDVRLLIEPVLGTLDGLHVIIFDRWATTPAEPERAQCNDVALQPLTRVAFDPDAIPIWEQLASIGRAAPPGAWDDVPTDLSKRIDDYLCGCGPRQK